MKAVVIGAGGHARSVVDAARLAGAIEIVGATDPDETRAGGAFEGVPVVGDDTVLADLRADGVTSAVIGIGGTGDNAPRAAAHHLLCELGFELPVVVHPSATVSPSATLGSGTVVLAGAVVGAGATVGANVIINSGAIIEHDCLIGDHAHVASGAVLGGAVVVEDRAHVGLAAAVLPGVRVGAQAIVGAGAVVLHDVAPGVTVVGVPATGRTPTP